MKEVLKKFILEEELSTSKTINDILGEHIEIPKDKTIIDILDTIDLCDYGLDLSSRETRTLIFLDLEKIVLLNTNSERLILLLNEDIEVFSSESVSFEDIERIKDKYIYRDRVLLKLKALKWVNLPLQLTMKDYQYQFSQFLEPLNYSKYLEKDLLEIKIEIIHLLKASISNIDLDIEDEYSRTIESILGVSLIMNDLKYESHKTKPSNADFLPIEIMKILNKPAINFLSTNKIYALSGENFAEGLKSKIIYDKKLSILKFLCSLKLLDRTIDKLDKDMIINDPYLKEIDKIWKKEN